MSAFIEGFFGGHDRERYEIYAYATSPKTDAVTKRLRDGVEHWTTLTGLDAAAATERIRQDAIDVLVDLSGHTSGNRLPVFARRAAPVQAHYLGYFASTGLSAMDYLISDATVIPESDARQYTETVWRLPRVWIDYQVGGEAPPPAWREDPSGRIWFGSFNKLAKLTPESIGLWSRILRECPPGNLLLKNATFVSAKLRQRVLDSFAAQGILAERIRLAPGADDWSAHMACYDGLDVALDPVAVHCGVITTCDALWMGVPVITLLGSGMVGRMGASILTALDRSEWIATDADDYVAKALRLAGDVAGRRSMRVTQRDRMRRSPLCDTAGLVRALEDAYAAMFDQWLTGQGV